MKWVQRTVTGEGSNIKDNELTIGSENVNLKANWTVNTYTITYDLDGGINATDNPISGEYAKTVTIDNPTRTGYTFNGWTVTGEGSNIKDNELTIGSENVNLKANWQPNSLIQSYKCANRSNGSAPYSFTYTGNCTIIDDGNDNWRIRFTSGGTFKPNISDEIVVFLVGGGGGGGHTYSTNQNVSPYGGSYGYSETHNLVTITAGNSYPIIIGGGGKGTEICLSGTGKGGTGGTSSAFGFKAAGGEGGSLEKKGSGGTGEREFGIASAPIYGDGGFASYCCPEFHSGSWSGTSGVVVIRNSR